MDLERRETSVTTDNHTHYRQPRPVQTATPTTDNHTYPSVWTLITERKRSNVCGKNCRDCACARGVMSSFSGHSTLISLHVVWRRSSRLWRNCSAPFPWVALHRGMATLVKTDIQIHGITWVAHWRDSNGRTKTDHHTPHRALELGQWIK